MRNIDKKYKLGMLNKYKIGIIATVVAVTFGGGLCQRVYAYESVTNIPKRINIQKQIISENSSIINVANKGVATTSYCSSWEDVTAVNDGYDPTSSSDRVHKVYGNWNNPGATQCVEYDFSDNYTLSSSDVYWFDDNQGIDLPASCSIQYWNGSSWVNVANANGLEVEGNKYNTTTFSPISTNKIRLNMTAKSGYSTGVLEWKVNGYKTQAENVAAKATTSTSFCSSWEDVTAVNDGYDPTSSSDRANKVYGNWNNPGATQWVEYDFTDKYTLSSSDVYWFDDNEGIDLPASCSFQYWNGTSWANVSDAKGLGVEGNKYNTTTFSPITTNKIRLNMTAKSAASTGVLEWKVYGEKVQSGDPVDNTKNPSKRELTQTPSWSDLFYKKCVYSYNIPILSSDKVSDAALFKAYDILDVMLKKIAVDHPEILQNMIKNHTRVDIVGLTEHNVDLPEWKDWPNKTERRAGGGIDTTICENELIMTPNDPNPGDPDVYYLTQFNVLSHEFTHTILMSGIGDADHQGAAPEIYKKIVAAYNNALAKDLYRESDYDRTNYHEYFAGQVPRWYNCNPTNLNVPNASSKTDKEQLKEYDPEIYSVIEELFGDYKMPEPWNK